MNKFAQWLRDESNHHLSRGSVHPIGDVDFVSVQVGMILSAEEIKRLSDEIETLKNGDRDVKGKWWKR